MQGLYAVFGNLMALSTSELLTLARGGVPAPALTVSQLLAQDYATAPFSAGILADDYRFAFYNSPLSKPFRWFQKIDTEEGERYEERAQAQNGTPMAQVRCLMWEHTFQIEGAAWGGQLESRTQFSVLPYEVEMNAGDLALLTQPESAKIAYARFTRAGAVQVLPHWPASQVLGVWVEGVKLATSTYSVTEDGLMWLAGAPAVPAEGARFSVRWKYLPLYAWSENEQGTLQLGADDRALPQIGQAHLLRDFDKTKLL